MVVGLLHNSLTGLNNEDFGLAVQLRAFAKRKFVFQFVNVHRYAIRSSDSTYERNLIYFLF